MWSHIISFESEGDRLKECYINLQQHLKKIELIANKLIKEVQSNNKKTINTKEGGERNKEQMGQTGIK